MSTRTPSVGAATGQQEPYPDEIQAIQAMPYGLKGMRRFAKLLGLTIHPFQAFMLGFYFAGVVELVIVIPKKNGKTTLLAVLALYHLLMVEGAECVIGAASKEQAALLHNQATSLILGAGLERRSISGQKWVRYEGVFEVREGMHVIRFERGRIRVMPHEVRTADGVIPTLALVDELHRHPTGSMYGVFRDGIDSQDGQMITISTAGANLDSPLGRLLAKAREFPMQRVGRRHTYQAPDKAFVVVEWALHPEDDPHNIRTVKQANPAPWHTVLKLRRRHDSPSMTPGQWLRFACGIWTHGDEPPISPAEWDRCRVDIGQVAPGDEVVLVPSVGHNAAIGIASVRDGGRIAVAAEVLDHFEGSMLIAVEDRIVELCDLYRVSAVHHPLGTFIRSADLLSARGVQMIEAPHSPSRLSAASGTFDRLMRSGLLMHDGDPTLRNHVLSAQVKTSEQGERYEIGNPSRALIAVAFAAHAASAISTEAPAFFAM